MNAADNKNLYEEYIFPFIIIIIIYFSCTSSFPDFGSDTSRSKKYISALFFFYLLSGLDKTGNTHSFVVVVYCHCFTQEQYKHLSGMS